MHTHIHTLMYVYMCVCVYIYISHSWSLLRITNKHQYPLYQILQIISAKNKDIILQ